MDSAEKQRLCELAERLLSEQNFIAAVIAGFVAMILSAATYGIVRSVSDSVFFSIAAAGIGIVIGFTMQYLGRGIDRRFAVVAAGYALLGCMLGTMFAIVMRKVRATGVSPFDIIRNAENSELYDWLFRIPAVADLMFWAIAIGAAAYFSRRALTREQGLALHTYERIR